MTIEMKKAFVKKWLDYQVEVFKMATKHIHCIDGISLCNNYQSYAGSKSYFDLGIHISDVDMIAKLLDLPVRVVDFDVADNKYRYEHQIVWNGVVFYGLYEYKEMKEKEKNNE